MDYHSMKRRELQALCKKHDIPANSANSVLADKLSELLNGKQKPRTQQRTCMKSPAETIDENEPAASRRQAKKVRFSNDLVEQKLRSGAKEKAKVTDTKARRNSIAKKVDNDDTDELVDDAVQIPVKLTRSRAQVLDKDNVLPVNEKKQSRRALTNVDAVKETEGNTGKVTRSKANKVDKGGVVQLEENKRSKRAVKEAEKVSESVEEEVVGRVRVTRSKAQTLTEERKKKNGRRVAKDEGTVEPSKEIIDIPVRVTRSRRETVKEETVAKPQAEKKRTRRDTKVVSEDNNELPKRKLPRTKGVDVADEGEKPRRGRPKQKSEETIVEVSESQHDADVASRKSRRNKSKVEDSKNVSEVEMVNDTKVTRSKAVKSKSKDAQKVKEPLKKAGRKNATGRKSVVQPKIVKSPNAGTRKTVGRKKEKGQNGNLPVADEGLEVNENVSGSQKSKKRRGEPIIEAEYVSPVVESPKRSTRSGGQSEVKSVAKKQESSLKTSASRTNINSSKKKAKLSEKKQSDSEELVEKSNTKRTPVSKMVSFEVDEKATESELTPTIDESGRRFTRSAIESEKKAGGSSVRKVGRKKSSQSAIKEQVMSSRKAPKFRPDPVMNTAPGRITRSGIKKSPKSVKKSICSDTKGVQSEVSKGVEGQIMEAAASDSESLATRIEEENSIPTSEAAIVVENVRSVSGEESHIICDESLGKEVMEPASAHIEKSSIESTPNVANNETSETPYLINNLFSGKQLSPVDSPKFEEETPSEKVISDIKKTPSSTAEVAETEIDELSDVQNQNEEVAVDLEKSVVKSPRAEEMESTKAGSVSKGNNDDADDNMDAGVSPVIHASVEQSGVKTGKEVTGEMSGTAYMIENLFNEKQQSPVPNLDDEELSTADVIESGINAFLDGSPSPVRIQNEEVAEKPEPEEQNVDIPVEGNNVDPDSVCYEVGSSAACHVPLDEQSDVKSKGEETETSGVKEGVTDGIEKDGLTSLEGGYNRESDDEQLMKDDITDGEGMDSEIGKEASREDNQEISTATATAADDETQLVKEAVCEDTQEMDTEIGEYDVEANTEEITIGDDDNKLPMDENDIKDDIVTDAAAKEVESVHEIPVLGQSGGDTLPPGVNMLEDSVLSVGEGDDDGGNANKDDVSDTLFGQRDDDDDETQPISDPTSDPHIHDETPFSDKDEDVENDGDTEPLIANDTFESPLFGDDIDNDTVVEENNDDQDGESEQEQLTTPAMDQDDFGDHHSESLMNISVPAQSPAQTANDVTSTQLDHHLDDSLPDINQDTLPNDFAGVADTENDGGNEQTIIGTSEVDEAFHSKESANVSLNISNEQNTQEADLATEDHHALGHEKEHSTAASDADLDADSIMEEDPSNHAVDEFAGNIQSHHHPTTEETSPITHTKEELEDQLFGDHEGPNTEHLMPITYNKQESLVDDTVSDPPTSFNSNHTYKQEETRNATTPMDLENFNFGIDGSDEVLCKSTKDVQSRAKLSFSIDESSGAAFDLEDPVTNFEKTFGSMGDGNSNWSEASMNALFTEPATTRTSVKHRPFSFGIDFDAVLESIKSAPQPSRVFNEGAPKNKSFGVANFQEYCDDAEAGGSGDVSGKDKKDEKLEFKFDQFDTLSEAGASRHDACGSLKVGKEEESEVKGSEAGDDKGARPNFLTSDVEGGIYR